MPHHSHEMLVTMVTAISVGVLLIAIARQIKVTAIVLLLLGGILLGPNFLGIINPESLGDGLTVIVSVAVGLILFEGGLTLDLKGYREASSIIRRLLTVGVLTTWMLSFAAICLLFGDRVQPSIALLAGSLVIVTGPTVIAPLLKRIKVKENVHNILHWEGVLIDPLGVFVTLLCYEWIVGDSGGHALGQFAFRVLEGLLIGLAGGYLTSFMLKRRLIPEDMINVTALGMAVLIFGVAEFIIAESGLLAVTVAGLVLGTTQPVELKQIRAFKAEITDLLIGLLFMLLAARLDFASFRQFGMTGLVLVVIVLFLVRPANVFLSTVGLKLPWKEKLFISWVAPRGIVAASMASFITLRLGSEYGADMKGLFIIESFTYSVIIATVLLQGFTAGPLANLLKLQRPAPTGYAIIGAHALGRRVASFIRDRHGVPVVLLDLNAKAVAEAQREGLEAIRGDARDRDALEEHPMIQRVGNVVALTDNEDLNIVVCERWAETLGRDHVYRWHPAGGDANKDQGHHGRIIWANLPKPSLLSAEISRGEAHVTEADEYVPTGSQTLTTPLAAMKEEDELVLDPRSVPKTQQEKLGKVLLLRREADYLTRSVRQDLIVDIESEGTEGLFRELVEEVVKVFPRVDKEETIKELIERESSFPTALGHGIAVPHAYVPALESRICLIARIVNGVDFHAPDNEDVDLAFLLLSPPGDPEGHLATMAEIARFVSDSQVRRKLRDAPSAAEVLSVVHHHNPSEQQDAPGAAPAPALKK